MLRQYIPARLEDNPHVDADEYGGKLEGLGSRELVKAMLHGDWNIVAGAYFDNIREDKHKLPGFVPPAHWTRFRSMDWGSAKPFSVGWWVVAEAEQRRIAEAEAERQRLATAERQRLEDEAAAARAAGDAAAAAEAEAAAARQREADAAAAAQAEQAAATAQQNAALEVSAIEQVSAVVVAVPPAAAPAKVAGISTAKTVDFEVTDLFALVKHIAANPALINLVRADDVKLRAYVRSLGMSTNLPGVKVGEKKTLRAA